VEEGKPAQQDSDANPLEPRHVCVPGRVRLHVGGLKGAPPRLARVLEAKVLRHSRVRWAHASALTGNIIVTFDPALGNEAFLRVLAQLLRGEADAASKVAPWHARPSAAALEDFGGASAAGGLSVAAAERQRKRFGSNVAKVVHGRSGASIFAEQFKSLPVAVLAGAAVLSLATGVVFEAAAIALVLATNAIIGYVTESRAEAALRHLRSSGPTRARILREGAVAEVPAEEIVPGDVLVLRPGTLIAADARLFADQGLAVTEAMLTGESLPVTKEADLVLAPATPLAERRNMVYRGTVVTSGSGSAVAIATGAETEAGRVQRLVATSEPPATPTHQQLARLGKRLAWLTAAAGLALFVCGRWRGAGALQMLRSAVSLAVASVPEGLPMVATTTHAIGVGALRERHVHVRRLDAIETLAAVSVVCFDKTGTLTKNRMSLAELLIGDTTIVPGPTGLLPPHSGSKCQALRMLLETGALCSEAELARADDGGIEGSSTEVELLRCAILNGIDVAALRRAKPLHKLQQRTASYRFMVTMHRDGGSLLLAVKGDPKEILARCREELDEAGAPRELAPARRAAIEERNEAMASKGLRVLGFAQGHRAESAVDEADGASDMIWLGAAALQDPIRPDARELVDRLHRAGIRTMMLTGDQCRTARAVAEEVDLAEASALAIVDAQQVEELSAVELTATAHRTDVFARVTPAQKLKIVRALQASGAVVGMVGDGINDSPALRAAHVGLAMGINGDAAAREVADIFLDTEELAHLADAVEQGRTTHANIRKSLRFILSTNSSEVLLMLAASAFGLGEGLTPLQLLWINALTDVLPGIGLALEAPDPHALERGPPSPELPLLGERDVAALLGEGTTLAAGGLLAGLYAAARFGAGSAQMQSAIFGSLVGGQLLHALACRSPGENLLERSALKPNPTLTRILAGSFAAQAGAFLLPPLRRTLGLTALGLADALVVAAAGILPAVVTLSRTRRVGTGADVSAARLSEPTRVGRSAPRDVAARRRPRPPVRAGRAIPHAGASAPQR
jgi:Ca2+-transporting ATPase